MIGSEITIITDEEYKNILNEWRCPHCGHTKYEARFRQKPTGRRGVIVCKNCRKSKTYKLSDMNDKPTEVRKLGISVIEFRSKNDPNFIMAEGLKTLTYNEVNPEKTSLYKSSEFKEMIGLPPNFSSREMEDRYEDYHGKCSSGIYWSHPKMISKLKEERVLK